MKIRSIMCKSWGINNSLYHENMRLIHYKCSIDCIYSMDYRKTKNNNNLLIYNSCFNFAATPKRHRRQKEYNDKWSSHLSRLTDKNVSLLSSNLIFVDQRYNLSLDECIKRVILLSRINYDETICIEIELNLDPRKGKEYIRGNITLPNGIGRDIKICVFLSNKEMEDEAIKAGADIIGTDDLLLSIGDGSILNEHNQYPFDIIIATPDKLRKIIPFGRQLGPKRLMPNAKLGTLTNNPINAIYNAKKGQISIRMIDGGKGKGIIQGPIGKTCFGEKKIKENILSFLKTIRDDLRPPGAKKQYFLKCILSSTQGRSYHVYIDHDKEPWYKQQDNQ